MALTPPEHYTLGFVFADADGTQLAHTTSLVGAVEREGFLRDPDGRLVTSAGPGTYDRGFIRDSNGALVVTGGSSTPPLYPFSGSEATDLRLPFIAESPWNQTLAEKYPGGVPIHPNTPALLRVVADDYTAVDDAPVATGIHAAFLGTDNTVFSMPVYIADSSTPRATVRYSGTYRFGDETSVTNGPAGPNDVTDVPIPAGVKPSPGSDSQVVIWDIENRLLYDFWACQVDGSGFWLTDGSGRYLCTNTSRLDEDGTGVPGGTWNTRGAGVSYIGGLIRKWEVDAGVINHALAVAFDWPNDAFVPPATKSDGLFLAAAANTIPEGAIIKLRADYPISDLPAGIPRIVATAMRDYGMIVIDNSASPKIYFESSLTGGWSPAIAANEIRDIGIDWNDLQVVDWTGGSTPEARPTGIAGVPTIIGSVDGGFADATSVQKTFTTASHTPLANERLLAISAVRGNGASNITTVTGNGATWTRLFRRWDPQNQIQLEVWEAVAPASPVAEGVTITVQGAVLAVCTQVLRLPVGSVVRKWQHKDALLTDSANPSTPLRGVGGNALVIAGLAFRLGNLSSLAAGLTQNGTTLVQGTAGNICHLAVATGTPSAGDFTVGGTLSGATEWVVAGIEIT